MLPQRLPLRSSRPATAHAQQAPNEAIMAVPVVGPRLQPRLSRRRPEPLGEARRQDEDRADFRHRRDEFGDRRQHRFHAVLRQRGDARGRARPAPARHCRHHQPAERAGRAAQGARRGRRLRSQGAARKARPGAARPDHRGRRGQFRHPRLCALHRGQARGLRSGGDPRRGDAAAQHAGGVPGQADRRLRHGAALGAEAAASTAPPS